MIPYIRIKTIEKARDEKINMTVYKIKDGDRIYIIEERDEGGIECRRYSRKANIKGIREHLINLLG